MDDQRRCQHVQPEGDVGAPRLPLRIAEVEAHGEREDRQAADEHERSEHWRLHWR